jgi:hypothetical protein
MSHVSARQEVQGVLAALGVGGLALNRSAA